MRHVLLAAAFALAAVPAAAETLYKLISPSGKVTYAQEVPKNFDGKVIKLEIDPNANTAEGQRAPTKGALDAKAREEKLRPVPSADPGGELADAKAKLQAARQAYEQARDNPGPDDVHRVGNAKGGARPVFSDEYAQKLAKLQEEVRQAQQQVEQLEHGR